MEGNDGGTTHRTDWEVSFIEQTGKVKFEKNRGDQDEFGGGKEGYRRSAVSWASLYGLSEIIKGQKLQSQFSQ
eukprot:6076960-Heterocapsa_arctica.AAC.1